MEIFQAGTRFEPVAAYRDYQRQRQMEVKDLLLENRIILVYGPIDPRNPGASPADIIMKLLLLQSEQRRKEIHMYIYSDGGEVEHAMSIYDTMQALSCPIATYCVGLAAETAALLLAGGAKGKRFALPHAKVMLHQPWGAIGGQAADMEIQAREIEKNRETVNAILAEHTGQPLERVTKDTDRQFWMSAQQAKEYGIVDEVLLKQPVTTEEDEG